MMALLEKDLSDGALLALDPLADLATPYLCCDGDADAALANADSPGKDRLYLFCG